MSLGANTGRATQSSNLLEALARGREDHQFFSHHFLRRELHEGQLEYVTHANATINLLATANRWGKTTALSHVHTHGCIYKTGGEPRYLDPSGLLDYEKFARLKYHTIHCADDLETTLLVWDEENKIIGESPNLQAFIKEAPRSKPPHIDFITGSRWKFRTLGHDASGIDGNSFYKVSIDEAGWVDKLQEKLDNVVRVRTADVRGEIHLVGTMKPGISRDFYKLCVRAGAKTGRGITFDHRAGDEDVEDGHDNDLDGAIREYLTEWVGVQVETGREMDDELWGYLAMLGIDRSEFADAIGGR